MKLILRFCPTVLLTLALLGAQGAAQAAGMDDILHPLQNLRLGVDGRARFEWWNGPDAEPTESPAKSAQSKPNLGLRMLESEKYSPTSKKIQRVTHSGTRGNVGSLA
jgi:hypothetical protein